MNIRPAVGPPPTDSIRWSTEDVAQRHRPSWLREVIGREYTCVEIVPPLATPLFNEMTIHPVDVLKFSAIRSSAIAIERLANTPVRDDQDSYFAVVLLSGMYRLRQGGREVLLRAGDISLYDATRPHRIDCAGPFAKLIVSIPRRLLRDALPGVEHCTARRVSGCAGLGAVTSRFLQAVAGQLPRIDSSERWRLAEHSVDLIATALRPLRPRGTTSARSRALQRVKDIVERRLGDCDLNPAAIARTAGLSVRYVNRLFNDVGTSPMRYVWDRRLERCHRDLRDHGCRREGISRIAYRWGFSDHAHFTRAFRRKYGMTPTECGRRRSLAHPQ